MNLANYIDHTILKPEATIAEIEKLCAEAAKFHFAAVCVNPAYVKKAAELLAESGVGIATVVGFPLGANTTETKTAETRDAIKNGATEIDMVMSIGLFKSGLFDEVKKDIVAVVDASAGLPVKVILETCLLTNNEISKACKISVEAGAAYVKTSTGFSSGGASVEAVLAMKAAVGDSCKIKASGGIRSRSDALAMIEAGAVRIGTSSGVAIVSG